MNRFVINSPQSDTYKSNLAALRSCFPKLCQRIESEDHTLPVPVQTCLNASGQSNAGWVLPGGQEVLFYEEDDIIGHINKQSADWHLGNKDFLFCIGIGLGYLPLIASQTIETQPRIVVFEPHVAIFDLALQLVDLRRLLQYPNLDLIVGPTVSVRDNIQKYQDRIFFGKIKLISHGPSRLIFGERFETIEKEVIDNIQLVRNKGYTAKAAGKQILTNTIANLPSLFSGPDLGRLKDIFKGYPAICVAAGPSLDKDLKLLKTIDDRAAILCCDSAVHTLVAAGIHPHMVVTADRLPVNYDKIRYDMKFLRDSVLVFGAEANPDNVRGYLGPRRFAVSADSVLLNRWLGPELGLEWQLPAMTSVSHTAIFTAMILGADPVVLVGMDFAFVTGRSHAQGSVFRYSANPDAMMPVAGVKGYSVNALPQLISDRRQIENTIVDRDARFIDVSLDGARIHGTEIRPLEEVVMTMLKPYSDITRRLNSVTWDPCAGIAEVVAVFKSMLTALKQFRKTCQQSRIACLGECAGRRKRRMTDISPIRSSLGRFEQRYDLLLRILKMVRYADVQELSNRLEHLRESQRKFGEGNQDLSEELHIYADHYESLIKAGALFETLLKTKMNYFQRERVIIRQLKSKSQPDKGLLALAEHYRDNGEIWKADQAYRLCLEHFPNDASIWLALGEIYADKGLWPIAYDHLSEMKTIFSSDAGVDGFEKRIVQQMSQILEQANHSIDTGDIENARRLVVEYLSVFPENEEVITLNEKLQSVDKANERRLSQKDESSIASAEERELKAKAIQYVNDGKPEWGIGLLEGLAEAAPHQGCRYREWVGDVRFELKDYASAAWHYQEALKVSQEKQRLVKKLQAAKHQQDDIKRNSAGDMRERDPQHMDRWISCDANHENAKALYVKAQKLIEKGETDGAIKSLEHLLSVDPDFAVAHNDLGVLFFNQGNQTKAEEHYHAAAQIDPHNQTYQKNLADFIYVVRGNVRSALEIYVKLLAENPADIEILLIFAQICISTGQHVDAESFLRRAVEIDPTDHSIKQTITLLESVKEGPK